jgi:serine/threonine-protein kinase
VLLHYRILRKLGEGGMGEVYLAEDLRLGRRVALKLLAADVSGDEERLRRFEQEACAASAINHQNIITLHDVGADLGRHFMAMEFIDGVTLREHLRSESMNLPDVLDVGAQIAAALAAAHSAGLVHRDIKPENVMIRASDRLVKVLDFGLAKPDDQEEAGPVDTEAATRMLVNTRPGVVMGTVAYMSPEQARGLETDARTDVWSLGCVLYEMLSGRLPFEGPTPTDVVSFILHREPPALSRFFRANADGQHEKAAVELERIVTKAMAKDADERYQTAKDLWIDLKRLKQRLEVDAEIERTLPPEARTAMGATISPAARSTISDVARSTSSAEYIVESVKRNRLLTLVLIVLLGLLIAGIYFYRHARDTEVAIESIAVLPFANESGSQETEYLSDGLTETIINALSQLPNLKVTPRTTVFRYKGRESDPLKAGRELRVRAVLSGRVVQRGDTLVISAELVDVRDDKQLWGERYDRRISDLIAVQRDISREISERLQMKLTGEEKSRMVRNYTDNSDAYQLYLKGRYFWNKRTAEDLSTALGYFEQAIKEDPNYALAYAGLADVYNVMPSYGTISPHKSFPKSIAAATKALEIDNRLAEAHTALAVTKAIYEWKWDEAKREFELAIEINPKYAPAYYFYSYSHLTPLGRHDEAIASMRRAKELEPLSLIINTNLGWAFVYAKRYDEALEQLRQTVEIDPNFPQAHIRLSEALTAVGKYDEAIAEALKAKEMRRGPAHSALHAVLAVAYVRAGKKDEARKLLAELKEASKHSYVSSLFVAKIHVALGEKEQALQYIQKSYEEHDYYLPRLKVEPGLEVLYNDPRFIEIARKVGLRQ